MALLSPKNDNISSVLDSAEKFELDECKECKWGFNGLAFGTSCTEHYANWRKNEPVLTVIAARDPGGTTPESTGRLCMVHNSRTPTDKSAQHIFDLWRAAVSGQWRSDDPSQLQDYTDPYLKTTYATNILLHGIPTKSDDVLINGKLDELKSYKKEALHNCAKVLNRQLECLRPKILIALGEDVIKGLNESGWPLYWESPKLGKEYRPAIAKTKWGEIKVFHVYHTAGRSTNQNAARLFNSFGGAQIIRIIADSTPNEIKDAVDNFRRKYSNVSPTEEHGMLVHLASWLIIGRKIREVYKDFGAEAGA